MSPRVSMGDDQTDPAVTTVTALVGRNVSGATGPGGGGLFLRGGRRLGELPELPFADHRHLDPLVGQPAHLDQLGPAIPAGDLQRVRPAAHEDVRRLALLRLHERPRLARRLDRVGAGADDESGERDALPLQARHAAEARLLRRLPEGGYQLARRLVALAARAEAAVDHLLEVVAAGEVADVLAQHRARDVAAEQHRGEEPDLIDVVALLPAPHPSPGDPIRDVEQVEGVRRPPAPADLMRRDAEVAQLQLLACAHDLVEW